MQTTARVSDVVTKLARGGSGNLAHLSDSELLSNTRSLVGSSNQLFAALLAHLAEVDARGLHRTRACSSLYTYCIYELRFSEDCAARRAGAAKLVKRFPPLLEAIAQGELHLTGLLMLGPHLTPENVLDVLARAKFRTKKELAKLVRELHPLPLVPDSIEPLGITPLPARAPTWEQYVTSLAPAVRELPVGERPRDWANDAQGAEPSGSAHGTEQSRNADLPEAGGNMHGAGPAIDAPETGAFARASASFLPAPARVEPANSQPPLAPQQYQMQFSTTEEHVQLVERAKGLLARSAPGKSLGELHLQAMKLLVQALEKQKFAVIAPPQRRTPPCAAEGVPGAKALPAVEAPPPAEAPPAEALPAVEAPPGAKALPAAEAPRNVEAPRAVEVPSESVRRGRSVPAAIRRTVFERDGGCCTFVDERGQRCRETHGLELHHRHPFGKRGPHTTSNLTLHCRAHNALAAERDFGAEQMARRRAPLDHETLAAVQRAAGDSNLRP
jgi:5-methylcytosine-specific restriction endonuclease McrA